MTRLAPRNLITIRLLAGALLILSCLASSAAVDSDSSAATAHRSQIAALAQALPIIYKSPAPKPSVSIAAATHWMARPGAPSMATSVDLETFVKHVGDGKSGVIRGVFVPGQFALSVIQQPENNATFVSNKRDLVTQFEKAARNGVTGLLAHNYLSGRLFYQLAAGQEVFVVYGDGAIHRYRVTGIHRFQKLKPSNLRSNLVDLSTGEVLTMAQVFNRFYRGDHHLTFQTCLEEGEQWDWGLTFFLATPIDNTGLAALP
jgi:hypothetical protein